MLLHDIVLLAATQNGIAPAGNAGYAAWPSLIGAEMMVNGDCSSGTGWTLQTGTVIAAGKMTMTAAGLGTAAENSGTPISAFIDGATYRTVFTIDSRTAGSVFVDIDGNAGTTRSTVGTFSEDIAYAFNDIAGWSLIVSTSATMQLDSFSVKSVGLLGVEGDWTFTGDATWGANGTIVLHGPAGPGTTAELTGTAKTAFDAGVSSSTACSVTLTPDPNDPLTGDLDVSMKGGVAVTFAFDGSGAPVTHTVTSGTGSGFLLEVLIEISGALARTQIALA